MSVDDRELNVEFQGEYHFDKKKSLKHRDEKFDKKAKYESKLKRKNSYDRYDDEEESEEYYDDHGKSGYYKQKQNNKRRRANDDDYYD